MKLVKVKIYKSELKKIDNDGFLCLVKTADAVKTDIIQSQTMPMDEGYLQKDLRVYNENPRQRSVDVGTSLNYGRRLYFHPEYKFQKDKNPNAGGMWFEPYMTGKKKNFIKNAFVTFMGEKL